MRAGGGCALLRQARLVFRLLRDDRVPTAAKLIVPAAVMYLISPLDVVPDLIPLLGQIDDIGLLVLSLMAFVRLCPQHLVHEHERALEGEPPASTTSREEPAARHARPDEPIDVQYRWQGESRTR